MSEKESLLIVDNREENILALENLLKEYFPEVMIFKATSASDGIRIATEAKVNGALINMQIPEMNGIEFCRRLKSDERTCHTPVILLVPQGTDPGLKEKGLEVGADDFIHSPFDIVELVARIKVMFRVNSAEEKLRRMNEQLELLIDKKTKELQESEEKYRSLYTNAPFSYQSLDKNGCFLDVDSTWLRVLGYEKEEVIGKYFADFLHPNWKPHFEENFPEFKRRGHIDNVQFKIRRKDGHYLDISFNGHVAYLPDGEFRQTHCVFQDITERKRMELELQQERERFSLAFEASPDAMSINRLADGEYVDINGGFTAITGFSREDTIGKTSMEIDIWADSADRKKLITQLEGSGVVNNMEAVFRAKDGRFINGLMSARMIELNGEPHILSITRDIEEIKQAQLKLHESEAKYRTVLEDMQESYYEVDLQGNLTFFNNSLCRLLGYPREELMNMNDRSYTDAENAKKLYQAFNKVYRTGDQTMGFDWEIIRKDGARRTIEASVSLRKDISGVPVGFGGVIRDITDKKLAEQLLLESEALFRGIYENVSIGLYRTTPDGRILTANPALIRMLGYSSFDELSQLNLESNPSQIPETPRSRFKEILEQHDRLDGLESAWRRKDGTLLWIRENARTVRDGNGNILYYEGTVEDVTQRKLAEDKLRESEGKYRLVFNNVPLGIFHYDTEGVILSCNDKFVEIIGSSKEQLVGLNMLNLPDQEIVEAVRESIGGNAWFYEGDYHSFTAEKVTPVRVFFTPLISEEGEIKGGAGIAEDITKRKQADAERESLQEQLLQSQKIESVGRLAGGVAHDYNNMLGVILGRAEMVLSKMDPDDPNHASMEAIMRAGKRSADLTRQLLAFARKQTIQPKVMNLNDTIESMLKMLRQIIGEHIDLSWQPARDLWTVEMDPVQVDQILANLCVNARDALPDMGKISIETENKIIDESYCTTHPESKPGRYVMLTVSDDGCGMDEETRSHIFDPFFTTKGVGEGTGLGLSTVYGIVKQNNGFINVYSELDKGTTFRIYIPQNGDTVSEETETKVTELPRGNGQRILLVEDEVVLLEMAKTMLEELGYQVKTASLPVEALSSLQGNTSGIDLLITDVVMPGMSGKELAGEVRKRCENVKVLFMSGYTANAIAHHGVLDKGVAFIQKPFSLRELAHIVREVLDKS